METNEEDQNPPRSQRDDSEQLEVGNLVGVLGQTQISQIYSDIEGCFSVPS